MSNVLFKIQSAIRDAVREYGAGEDINSALAKSSSEQGLNLEMVKRAVEGLNNVMFIRLPAAARKGTYPLAESHEVISRMHNLEKAAASFTAVTLTAYDGDVPNYVSQYGLWGELPSIVPDVHSLEKAAQTYDGDVQELATKAYQQLDYLRKMAEASLQQHTRHYQEATSGLLKLSSMFSGRPAPSFREFEEDVIRLFGVEEALPYTTVIAKSATVIDGRASGEIDEEVLVIDRPEVSLFKGAMEAMKKHLHASHLHQEFKKEAAAREAQLLSRFCQDSETGEGARSFLVSGRLGACEVVVEKVAASMGPDPRGPGPETLDAVFDEMRQEQADAAEKRKQDLLTSSGNIWSMAPKREKGEIALRESLNTSRRQDRTRPDRDYIADIKHQEALLEAGRQDRTRPDRDYIADIKHREDMARAKHLEDTVAEREGLQRLQDNKDRVDKIIGSIHADRDLAKVLSGEDLEDKEELLASKKKEQIRAEADYNEKLREYALKKREYTRSRNDRLFGIVADPFKEIFTGSTVVPELKSQITKDVLKKLQGRPETSGTGVSSKYTQAIAGVKSQAILQSLLQSDEILKHQNPEDVAAAYSLLREVAPTLSGYPQVVKAFLRSAAGEGVIDPFVIEQLAKSERSLEMAKALRKSRKDGTPAAAWQLGAGSSG
jgi:hypothetical protein